jgi:hypothetical protein
MSTQIEDHMYKNVHGTITACFITTLLLTVVTVFAFAQPTADMKEMISENYGTIRESFFSGPNNGIIVHIQDLHCNYDAQISIYNIINELIDNYHLGVVAVEGCVGELDTAPYSKRPNDSIKEKTVKYFLKQGYLDGAGFAHIMRHSGFVFWGADDAKLHEKNVTAYKESIKAKEDNIRYYNNINEIVQKLKDKAYGGNLKELDLKISGYKQDKISLNEYANYIKGIFTLKGIETDIYPNFLKLIDVLEKESGIDFLEVDSQRAEYVDMLSKQLDKEKLQALVDKSFHFKTGKITPVAFYSYLEETASSEGISAFQADYSQLAMYISYIKLYSQIDSAELFKEIDNMEESIKEVFFENNDQRRIDRLSRTIDIIRDMFELKLTKETLQYYRDNRKEASPAYLINSITDMAEKYKVTYKFDPAFRQIAARLPDIERFYHIAEERDAVLVNNTIDLMRKNKADIAVLVAGGFHTEGISRLLKEKNISYIVVTPKIENLDSGDVYQSILLGKKAEI